MASNESKKKTEKKIEVPTDRSPQVSLSTAKVGDQDTLVVGCYQTKADAKKAEGKKGAKPSASGAPKLNYIGAKSKEWDALLSKLNQSDHFSGRLSQTNFLRYYSLNGSQNTLLVGLGPIDDISNEAIRKIGGTLHAIQKSERIAVLKLAGDSFFKKGKSVAAQLEALFEGYLLGSYQFNLLKKPKEDEFFPQGLEVLGISDAQTKAIPARTIEMAKAVNFARSLGDRPANYLTPTHLAEAVQASGKEYKYDVTVWGRSEIEKHKMGLFLGVARGSEQEPKFIIMKYQGGKKSDKPVALVGKGVTFDAGGISLKPAAKMEEMKYDMMGSAAVAGTMQAIAALKLPINVIAFIGAAENMPDGKAQKPGDVASSSSGKTVEIINTDAEGRLILADALEYAQTFEPQAIIDFATLTGAVIVALGSVTSGIMGNHPELLKRIKDASALTDERVWELPLYKEYDDELRSNFADIKNSGGRDAGSSQGGCFLKFFVDPKFPWVHCDIAGTAWGRKDANYLSGKYGTGVMVRTMTQLLANWKPLR